jgi:sugar phosphate isomerase/epimerase
MERRAVLRSLAAATALAAAGRGRVVRAIEPIARNGGSRFKFSLAAYSYRDLLSGPQPQLTLAEFVEDCARLELDGTELTSYYFPPHVPAEYLLRVKQQAFRLGLDISGTAVGNDFCHRPGPERSAELANVKRWIDHAATLGAPVVRIFAGTARGPAAEAHRLVVEGIEECCHYAGERGIYLALENHGGVTAGAEEMLAVVQAVRSPWFGVNLDTGNFHSADPYAELERLAPYAVNVQLKVMMSRGGGTKEPADLGRLARMLRAAGYRGYVVLEYEEPGDPRAECARYVPLIRTAFQGV